MNTHSENTLSRKSVQQNYQLMLLRGNLHNLIIHDCRINLHIEFVSFIFYSAFTKQNS